MTIHTASKHSYPLSAALGLVVVLTACGGGSSGGGNNSISSANAVSSSSSKPAPDTTPASFTFAPIADAAVNSMVSSGTVSVTGIDQGVPISITGGTYSIADGEFTNVAGTVSNNQTVVVKVTSSASTNTAVEAVLTVGGVTGSFKVTTKPDVTPDAFTFTTATGVVPKSVSISSAITVAGVDVDVPISITGGEYSINDGAFTSAAGTVSKTQTVKVRGTASANLSASTNVELTVGGVKGTYAITTLADTVAPTAQILFPPPISKTEGNTILVRGTASDDYSTVTSVKVNGITATTSDGFKNWQALVPLADTTAPATKPTENAIKVVAEDSAGNKSNDAAHVAVRQDLIDKTFPDKASSDISLGSYIGSMLVDKSNGRNRLLVSNQSPRIISIDLDTLSRTNFSSAANSCDYNSLAINASNDHIYAPCDENDVYEFDLLDSSKFKIHSSPLYSGGVLAALWSSVGGAAKFITVNYDNGAIITADEAVSNQSVLSDATKSIPNALNPIIHSQAGIVFDKDRNRYLVSDISQQIIFAVDAVSGERTIFSSNLVGTGEYFGPVGNHSGLGGVNGTALDSVNQRLIVTDAGTGIFAIDLITGNRTLISSNTTENASNQLRTNWTITIVDPNGYALLSDYDTNGIYAVDLVTGYRVVFTKD